MSTALRGLIVGLVLLVAACGGTTHKPSPIATPSPIPTPSPIATDSLTHYDDGRYLSFDYPANWQSASFAQFSSNVTPIAYLSTEPMSDPCDRTPNMISCTRLPVAALGPNGILVTWNKWGFLGWEFDPTAGIPLHVGGRQATLEQKDVTEYCDTIGAERALVVTVDQGVPYNWTELIACLRGPALDDLQAQIEAMLATVEWRQPAQ